jgi:uncharacterized membrane protein (DUF106 family)
MIGAIALTAVLSISASGSTVPINWVDTGLVVLMAVGVNLLYAVGRRKFTDIDKMRRYNAEMKAFRSEMTAAMRSGDKQKQEKLKKKQSQMNKMQMEMSKEQFKPTLLFMAPLWGLYYFMSTYVVPNTRNIDGHTVQIALAIFPFQLPFYTIGPILTFFWWYFICSFSFSGVISRLFGLTMD